MKALKQSLTNYKELLKKQELAPATIRKYVADAEQFTEYAEGLGVDTVTKQLAIDYKAELAAQGHETSTINNKITTTNKFLRFAGFEDCTVKNIKIQTRDLDNVMTQTDYDRILRQAGQKGTDRDIIMLETLYRTGLRVSELAQFTMESLAQGFIAVDNKGKQRKVPVSNTLDKIARAYAKEQGITSGTIILNAQGQPLSRNYIYKQIKYLAGQARVKKARAYPHSIRHLFAKNWIERNGGGRVTQLADILGHGSLNTTRIYTKQTVHEARATMD